MKKLIIISILALLLTVIFSLKLGKFVKDYQDSKLVHIGNNVYVSPKILNKF